MRRREVGAAVVAAAVLLAVIVPNIGGRAMPGRPQAIPVLPAPAIGDCLLTPATLQRDPNVGDSSVSADVKTQLGPCAGARYGEVAAIVHADGSYTAPSSTGRINIESDGAAVSSVCGELTKDYQGMPKSLWNGYYANRWNPSVQVFAVPLRPDAEQQAAGQTWTACVTAPTFRSDLQSTYPTAVRAVFLTGTPAPGLGQCEDVADIEAALPVPCDQPHKVETFGQATNLFANIDPAREKLQTSCVELAALLTRITDPGSSRFDGLDLSVELIHYDDASGAVRAGPVTDPLTQQPAARCRVITTSDRTLSGSLVGLGDRAVPWT